jgi:hypothetical protein
LALVYWFRRQKAILLPSPGETHAVGYLTVARTLNVECHGAIQSESEDAVRTIFSSVAPYLSREAMRIDAMDLATPMQNAS